MKQAFGIVFGVILIICAIDCVRVKVVDDPYQYNGGIVYSQPQYQQYDAPILVKPKKKKDEQDLSKIPGVPGHDYPTYHSVPHTSFTCHNVPVVPGMYADPETGCQAYHVCHDGREGETGANFLCTNGTLFNQQLFACDWWYNVDCHQAQSLWRLNADPELNPYTPKKKIEHLEPY